MTRFIGVTLGVAMIGGVAAAQSGQQPPPPQTRLESSRVQGPKLTPLPEPKYADNKARQVVRRAVNRYKAIGGVQFLMEGGPAPVRIVADGQRIRESSGGVVWSHVGGTLTMARGTQMFRGNCVRAEVLEYVAVAGRRVDPVARYLLLRQNLIQAHFAIQATARSLGTATIRGRVVDLVEIKSPGATTTLAVRSDGLLASLTTSLVEGGRSFGQTERRFTYERIGRLPSTAFAVGKPPYRPLPKLPG